MTQYTSLDGGSENTRESGSNGSKSRTKLRAFSRPTPSLSEPLNTPLGGAANNSGDPFYVFQDDLYKKLELVDESLAEFLRVVHQTDTAVNLHEFKEAKKQMKRHIKNAESVLEDLHSTVQLVEKDREKFSKIDSAELFERKALVSSATERISQARAELTSESVKEKMLADERAKSLRRANGNNMGAESEVQQQNTDYIVDSQARASLLMRQQDEALDTLGMAVSRVGHMAENIHEEIGAQNKILEEMDDDLANAEEQLGMVLGKLAKLLKTKNKCQLGTIMCLIAVAVVLFLLVLYT